mgnify:CR=1 FL=1
MRYSREQADVEISDFQYDSRKVEKDGLICLHYRISDGRTQIYSHGIGKGGGCPSV